MTDEISQEKSSRHNNASFNGAIVLILLSLGGYYFVNWKDYNGAVKSNVSSADITDLAIKELNQFFSQGLQDLNVFRQISSCELLSGISERNLDQLACNPLALQCYLENGAELEYKGVDEKKRRLKALPFYEPKQEFLKKIAKGKKLFFSPELVTHAQLPRVISKDLLYKVRLLNEENKSFDYYLRDNCRDTALPQKVYVYKEHSKNNSEDSEIVWNSIGTNFYLDKLQLKNWKILLLNEAISSSKRKDPRMISWRRNLFESVVKLSLSDMKYVCSLLDGEISQSHIWDAGTFYPLEEESVYYNDRSFPPFPWTKRTLSEPFYQHQIGKREFNEDLCKKIQTKECSPNLLDKDFAISWIGIKEVLGSNPEFMINNFNPLLSLRASSRYLEAKNKFNRLGMRAEFSFNNDFELGDTVVPWSDLNYSFRCMRRRN